MSRLSPFGQKYKTSQPQEGFNAGTELRQTGEKQNKYYSSQDVDGTIRKRLIDQYPEIQQEQEHKIYQNKAQELGISTKYSHSSKQKINDKLLTRLEGSLNSYQPKFNTKNKLKKIDFTVLDLEEQDEQKKQLIINSIKQIPKQPQIATKIEKQRLIQEGQKLIQDMLPKRRVSHIDKQISALYKQNRNINLEYRRDKFMQIFVGTPKFPKSFNTPFI